MTPEEVQDKQLKRYTDLYRGYAFEERKFERPRYYQGMLLTANVFNTEQDYFLAKHRLHNALLHGWGVVCGAVVRTVQDANGMVENWKLSVSPGFVLDPYGNEIFIANAFTIDLRDTSIDETTNMDSDSSYTKEHNPIHHNRIVFVVVKYVETMARMASCAPTSGEEFSRIVQTFEIRLFTELPASHTLGGESLLLESILRGPSRKGLLGEDDSWVVLASIMFDKSTGLISAIDNDSYRRTITTERRKNDTSATPGGTA